MSETRTCLECKQNFPLASEYFGATKKNKSGFNPRCRSCAQAKRREAKRTREEAMTDEEWRTDREKRLAKRKEYREKNRDKLIQQKRTYRKKVSIPKWLRELERLRRLCQFRDNRDAIKQASSEYDAAARRALGGYNNMPQHESRELRRELYKDPRYARYSRLVTDYEAAERKALYASKGRNWLEDSIAELKANLESCSPDEIKDALAFEASRDFVPERETDLLRPAEKRLFTRLMKEWERREAAMSDAEKADRWKKQWEAIWRELKALEAEGLMDAFWRAEARQAKKEHFAEKDGRAAPTPDPVQPSWGALNRHLDARK